MRKSIALETIGASLRYGAANYRAEINKSRAVRKCNVELKKYLASQSLRKLHIGAGENILDGWFNADIAPDNKKIWYLDASRAFTIEDKTFDYIYNEHIIEHLTFSEGAMMLSECKRILRVGGKIRIATPNLLKFIGLFEHGEDAIKINYIKWATERYLPCFAKSNKYNKTIIFNNFVRAWGHQFIYDPVTLKDAMEEAGFIVITECALNESRDENFRNVEMHDRSIGEEANRFETMVFEAGVQK